MAADYTNELTQLYNQMNATSLSNRYSASTLEPHRRRITLGNPTSVQDSDSLPVEWEYGTCRYRLHLVDRQRWRKPRLGNIDTCTIGWTLDDGSALGDYAWYCARNIVDASKEIGQNLPNGNGLYDMHGNVWEWCHDGYSTVYPINATTNYVRSPGNGRPKRRQLAG